MIEKLRRKFILVTMAIVFLVMLVVLVALNATNYFHTAERADEILSVLAGNGGKFPDEEFSGKAFESGSIPPNQAVSIETPFETRYFTAITNSNRQIIQIDTTKIRSVDSEAGQIYAEDVLASNKTKGYLDDFRYKVVEKEDGTFLLLFVDSQRELQTMRAFLQNSLSIGLISLVFIFLLVFYFSKKIIKPVQESIDRQKQFITDMGHEIKTPLAIISANNDVQQMLNGDTEWTKSTGKQIHRLNGLMESMLQLTQMEEETYQPKIEPINFSQVLREACEPYILIGEQKNVTVSLDIQPNIIIQSERDAINKLCSLLMDNANKYVCEPGTIQVRLDSHQHKIRLIISNTVSEMPQNFNRLFDRFYREDQARKHTAGGYGIGLSLAAAIVESYHGQIQASPLNEETIAFEVVLPLK